jgi:phosphoenolpyruvate synthase/pyruvate phosphate dikinase
LVPAEVAGVMLTVDPVRGHRSQIVIEGSVGLGAAVVAGEVTPDRYYVDKVTLEVRSRVTSRKHLAHRFDTALGEVRAVAVPVNEQRLACVTDAEVIEIASLGKRVKRVLGSAQDIEWAIGLGPLGTREVFLLQTRPETGWTAPPRTPAVAGSSPLGQCFRKAMRFTGVSP